MFFSWSEPYLVVTSAKIKLGEPPGARQFVQEFVDYRHCVFADNCPGIEATVVDAESPGAVLFH